jgi:hypothetical protein
VEVLLPLATVTSDTACARTARGLRELMEAAWAPAATEWASMFAVACLLLMDRGWGGSGTRGGLSATEAMGRSEIECVGDAGESRSCESRFVSCHTCYVSVVHKSGNFGSSSC